MTVVSILEQFILSVAHHEWLLSEEVDILPFLLLPLAGPEELSEEENEGNISLQTLVWILVGLSLDSLWFHQDFLWTCSTCLRTNRGNQTQT